LTTMIHDQTEKSRPDRAWPILIQRPEVVL
jgi:hypothetical protein